MSDTFAHYTDDHVSNLGLDTSHVELRIGKDPTELNQLGNPSGFDKSFSTKFVQRVLEVIGEECDRIFTKAPAALSDLIPPEDRKIAIYRPSSIGFYAATLSAKNAKRLRKKNEQQTPLGYLPPQVGGMYISLEPDGDLETLRMKIGHEMTHLVSLRSIHVNDYPIIESLVARIERDVYGERRSLTSRQTWNPNTIQNTSGFLSQSNFGTIDIEGCPSAIQSMYLASYFASNLITAEQVWQVWTILAQDTKNTGLMPHREKVVGAIQEVLGSDADALLDSPIFKVMQNGGNHATVESQDQTEGLAHTFHATPNIQFGPTQTGIEFVAQQAQGRYAQEILSTNSQKAQIVGQLEPTHTFTFESQWQQYCNTLLTPPKPEIKSNVTGIQISIANLKPMNIKKPVV